MPVHSERIRWLNVATEILGLQKKGVADGPGDFGADLGQSGVQKQSRRQFRSSSVSDHNPTFAATLEPVLGARSQVRNYPGGLEVASSNLVAPI